ncbi:MAG: DNA-binding transcriptional regulator [Verrucomicrobiales bacterium]|nr:DNA-binding transcriptional regulator [Verrucomicrobiales bacterium]
MKPNRKKVALLVETSLGSGREILRGIANFAGNRGDWEMIHAARGLDDEVPDWIKSWKGDGVIARVQNPGIVEKLKKRKIPVVDVLGVSPSDFPLVHVDDRAISRLVAKHFLHRAFRHFGYYGIQGENWSQRREEAFKEFSSDGDSFSGFNSPRGRSEGYSGHFLKVQRWLMKLPKPVAVMVCSDQRGLLLLEACRAAGITVPGEVCVVGVDNDIALCEISTPNLSSVRGGHFRVGYEAAELLDQMMNGAPAPESATLVPPNEIVVRESSDSRGISDAAVRVAIQFMKEHFSEPVTNDQIAKAAGLSKTRLQIRFRASVGMSLREFLLEHRLSRAVGLITSTDLTFSDIAQRCGFRHHEYLGYVLKNARGLTPRQLRMKGRDGG